jgi:hypothetical protein
MIIIYIAVVVVGLVVLGDSQPKIALAIAALVLFSAILINKNVFSSLISGGSVYKTGFGGFGNGQGGGAGIGLGGSHGGGAGRI